MRPLRIVLVEDERSLARIFAEVLAGMGHDVCAIEEDESGAIAAAARCKPDLMIVDVRLGEGSGVAAVTEILRKGFVAHLFVSGDTSGVLAQRPAAVTLQKPFFASQLIGAMKRALTAAPHL